MDWMKDTLAKFYERDIRKLIEEIILFKSDQNLWKTAGAVKNSSGNIALHIIGGTNHLIGAQLAHSGYIRNRDAEFSRKDVDRAILVDDLESLMPMITKTLREINLDDNFPIPFDDAIRSNGYVLTQLLVHLNYHLGQVNYLRRMIEQ